MRYSPGVTIRYSYRFYELAERPESQSDQVKAAILEMLRLIKEKTPYVDVLADPLRLQNVKTFRSIVVELANVSFQDSSLDSTTLRVPHSNIL
jgi:type I restriction enzyme M protein